MTLAQCQHAGWEMGTQLPPKGTQPPIFGQCPLWPNGWTKMPLGMEGGLGPGDFVFDGDWGPSYPRKKAHCTPTRTQFLAHVYYDQKAGWMN